MNNGCNVVVWNYRGYGGAKGSPTPKNIRWDGMAVYKFVWETLQIKGKIGVYGWSLGGIVATHIAWNTNDVDLLIADRTLANLDLIPQRKGHGKYMHWIFRLATCGWKAKNDLNYFHSNVGMKILTCDPADDVIDTRSSLLCGVALVSAKQMLSKNVNLYKTSFVLSWWNLETFYESLKKFFEIYTFV